MAKKTTVRSVKKKLQKALKKDPVDQIVDDAEEEGYGVEIKVRVWKKKKKAKKKVKKKEHTYKQKSHGK